MVASRVGVGLLESHPVTVTQDCCSGVTHVLGQGEQSGRRSGVQSPKVRGWE